MVINEIRFKLIRCFCGASGTLWHTARDDAVAFKRDGNGTIDFADKHRDSAVADAAESAVLGRECAAETAFTQNIGAIGDLLIGEFRNKYGEWICGLCVIENV